MTARAQFRPGELVLSLALLALGAFVFFETRSIPDTHGAGQIGPRFFPYLIGLGLTASGGILGWQVISGGWRNLPSDAPGHDRPDWIAFALVSAGIILHMVLVGWAGFIIASTVLFVLVARGFGSTRILRDVAIGAALAAAAFFVFTVALGLSLPKGLLGTE